MSKSDATHNTLSSTSGQDTCDEQTESRTPVTDFLDILLFVPFLLCFLSTLIAFDLLQRIALCIGPKWHTYSVLMLQRTLIVCLKILGTRINLGDLPELDPNKGYVIVSNHQSLFDIPILHTTFHQLHPRFIAKKELSKFLPSVSFNLRNGGCLTIDRSNGREAIVAIARYAKTLASNSWSTVLFPEGTRARNGILKEFKGAGFAALLKHMPDAQVIPVALDGSWKLAVNRYGPIPRGLQIKLVVGGPIERGNLTLKEYQEVSFNSVRELFESIQSQNDA